MGKARRSDDEDDLEEFTDLSGDADEHRDPADLTSLEDLESMSDAQIAKQARARADEDLEVVDDDETDEDGNPVDLASAGDPADEAGAEDEEEDEPAAARPTRTEILFDPKDVQIVLKDVDLLNERENTAKAVKDRVTKEVERINTDLEAAEEAGDTKRKVSLINQLADAKVTLTGADNAIQSINADRDGLKRRAQELIGRAPKDKDGKPVLQMVTRQVDVETGREVQRVEATAKASKPAKWADGFVKNNAWFSDPKQAAKANVLRALDAAIMSEGKLDKNSNEYALELGKRFNRQFPGIFKMPDGKPIATGQRRRNNGRGAAPIPNNGGASVSSNSNSRPSRFDPKAVKLTTSDLDLMKTFEMDPDNMDHRRQWLSTKRENAKTDFEQSAAGNG